jgi:hypothetical protein
MACVLVAPALAGCGHSGSEKRLSGGRPRSPPASACLTVARDLIGTLLDVPEGTIAVDGSIGNNTMPQCAYTVRVSVRRRVVLTVNVDTAPQPYFRLERTAIEAAQVFTANRMIAAPQAVTGLGIEADWFPAETQLMATDGRALITVTVGWHGVAGRARRRLAIAIARTYLRWRRGSGGAAQANGYPSG